MNLNIKDEDLIINVEGTVDLCNEIAQTVFYFKGAPDWISSNHKNNNKDTIINQNINNNLPDNLKEKLDNSPLNKTHKKNLIEITEKYCPICTIVKPVKEFNKSKHDRTGYQSYCRECSNKLRLNYPTYHKKKNKRRKKTNKVFEKTPDNTTLFSNWLNKQHKEVFDITEFMINYPDIPVEKLQKIISDQIAENKILQLSDSQFKICKKEQNIREEKIWITPQ